MGSSEGNWVEGGCVSISLCFVCIRHSISERTDDAAQTHEIEEVVMAVGSAQPQQGNRTGDEHIDRMLEVAGIPIIDPESTVILNQDETALEELSTEDVFSCLVLMLMTGLCSE